MHVPPVPHLRSAGQDVPGPPLRQTAGDSKVLHVLPLAASQSAFELHSFPSLSAVQANPPPEKGPPPPALAV